MFKLALKQNKVLGTLHIVSAFMRTNKILIRYSRHSQEIKLAIPYAFRFVLS